MTGPDDSSDVRRQALHWLTVAASGEATPDELAALVAWRDHDPRHAEAFLKIRKVWHALHPAGQRFRAQHPQTVTTISKVRRVNRRMAIGGAMVSGGVAAFSLAALRPPFHLWPSLSELGADYRTAAGQQRLVAIATGVSVMMNTLTSIALEASTSTEIAMRLIDGEVTVQSAVSQKRVAVVVGSGTVSINEAKINIRFGDNTAGVTCLTGHADIVHRGTAILLNANQGVVYDQHESRPVRTIDADVVTAWERGVLRFEQTPLSDVVQEVNRYRAGKIVLLNERLGRRHVSGQFKLDRLDDVVDQIRSLFGAEIRTLPGGFTLVT